MVSLFGGDKRVFVILVEVIMSIISVTLFWMSFKDILYLSGCQFNQQSKTICAILVEGIIRNIHLKLF